MRKGRCNGAVNDGQIVWQSLAEVFPVPALCMGISAVDSRNSFPAAEMAP